MLAHPSVVRVDAYAAAMSGAAGRGRRSRAPRRRRRQVREPAGERDALRGAGVDHVAGSSTSELADRCQIRCATPKIMSAVVRVLARLAVDPASAAERLRVGDLVGGDQPRAERVERLAALALAHWPPDARAGTRARRRRWRPRSPRCTRARRPASRGSGPRRPMTTPSSTSQSVFSLPRGMQDVVVRADDRVGRLEEHDRLVGRRGAGLGGVRGVVQPDAEDHAGTRDRRADPQPGGVERGQVGGRRAARVRARRRQEGAVDVGGEWRQVEVPPPSTEAGRSRPAGRAA